MQWTGAAGILFVGRQSPGAAPATDRHYVMRRRLLTFAAALSLLLTWMVQLLENRLSLWRPQKAGGE